MDKAKPKSPKNTVRCMAIQTDFKGANRFTNTKMLTPRLTYYESGCLKNFLLLFVFFNSSNQ